MATHCAWLDRLPVELVHQIWGYLSAHEILHSFLNLSSYLDEVLLKYPNYSLNFNSIRRAEFDFVCRLIKPDQVISLTLSDDENTPGQLELFFSRFAIDQFTRLRSLRLIQTGEDFWQKIIQSVVQLKELRSFMFISSPDQTSWCMNISSQTLNQLDKDLFEIYRPILPQLTRLRLSHGDFFQSCQFPFLRHLKLNQISFRSVQHLSKTTLHLQTFETKLNGIEDNDLTSFSFPQLIRLVLSIEDKNVSIEIFKQILENLPRLQHLELMAGGDLTLADGQQWEILAANLLTFNFKFDVSKDRVELDSFSTPFWLEEKQWFVAYIDEALLTVSYFCSTYTESPFLSNVPIASTNIQAFYDAVTALKLDGNSFSTNERFNHVKTLTLRSPRLPMDLDDAIDLTQIRHLILSHITNPSDVISFIKKMGNLVEISLPLQWNKSPEQYYFLRMENILRLNIHETSARSHSDPKHEFSIDELYSIFPNITHLCVTHMCHPTRIMTFLQRFPHLLNASFRYRLYGGQRDQKGDDRRQIESTFEFQRSIGNFDFTYRFDTTSVYLWLLK